jgi:hypothetical protein
MLTNSYHSFFMVNVVQQQDTSLFRQMMERVTNDKNQNTKVGGCRVDAKEYNVLKQYADIFYKQQIQDPETKQN